MTMDKQPCEDVSALKKMRCSIAMLHLRKLACPLKKGLFSVGNTSSNHWFSGDMLVFRGINFLGWSLWTHVKSVKIRGTKTSAPLSLSAAQRSNAFDLRETKTTTDSHGIPSVYPDPPPSNSQLQMKVYRDSPLKMEESWWSLLPVGG